RLLRQAQCFSRCDEEHRLLCHRQPSPHGARRETDYLLEVVEHQDRSTPGKKSSTELSNQGVGASGEGNLERAAHRSEELIEIARLGEIRNEGIAPLRYEFGGQPRFSSAPGPG